MKNLLRSHKVIVCMGTGGVGKTTVSAALGILAAREGLRTLVLTIDPAQRLAQALAVDGAAGKEVMVPAPAAGGRLFACMIDPKKEFDGFVRGNTDNRIAEGLMKNPLYQQLVTNLNGSQEFTSLVRLQEASASGKYDLIVLDTPPAQNAVDFLRAPDRLYALFQESVIRWFVPGSGKEGFFARIVHKGTSLVVSALESVTGSQFISELKDFFSHLSHLQKQVAEKSLQTRKLLFSPQTAYVLVTGFDETKLKEASEFQVELWRERLNLRGIVVNRAFPTWASDQSISALMNESDPGLQALAELYRRMEHYFRDRLSLYDRFEQQVADPVPIVKIPDYNQAVVGFQELSTLADKLHEKWGKA